MKTVIMYASIHHNNTKDLVCAIAAENDIDVVDATKITEKDLSGYDLIGFASGIYFDTSMKYIQMVGGLNIHIKENLIVTHTKTYA